MKDRLSYVVRKSSVSKPKNSILSFSATDISLPVSRKAAIFVLQKQSNNTGVFALR